MRRGVVAPAPPRCGTATFDPGTGWLAIEEPALDEPELGRAEVETGGAAPCAVDGTDGETAAEAGWDPLLVGGPDAGSDATGGAFTDGTLGTVTDGTVTGGTVMPGTVTPGTVTDGTVTDGTVTPATVTDGVVTPGSGTDDPPGTDTVRDGTVSALLV